jgi:hypothetical protein
MEAGQAKLGKNREKEGAQPISRSSLTGLGNIADSTLTIF